jgi:hypothetical protein
MKKIFLMIYPYLFVSCISGQLNIISEKENINLIGRVRFFSGANYGEINSSLIYFQNKNKYLLSFSNRVYDYKFESFWINEVSKNELYQLIIDELPKKEKNKSIKIKIDDKRILSLEMHKNKLSLNVWDGYKWYKSYWYKLRKIKKLFYKNKGRVNVQEDGLIQVETGKRYVSISLK